MCCYSFGKSQKRRSVGRALDWVGAKRSAIAFLFLFIVINPSASLWAGYEANKNVSLGILGLNEDFVQLNEVMTIVF